MWLMGKIWTLQPKIQPHSLVFEFLRLSQIFYINKKNPPRAISPSVVLSHTKKVWEKHKGKKLPYNKFKKIINIP